MKEICCKDEQINERKNNEKFNFKLTFITGLKTGLRTTWLLAKIMIPVFIFVTVLEYTHILALISKVFEPIMRYVGLPGEAALVLVLGNTVNLYAAVGAVVGLSLTAKQITIIAVMLSFSHSLFMETAVAKKTGISAYVVLSIRFLLAIISGIILNILL